jgi:hypothetical protein
LHEVFAYTNKKKEDFNLTNSLAEREREAEKKLKKNKFLIKNMMQNSFYFLGTAIVWFHIANNY